MIAHKFAGHLPEAGPVADPARAAEARAGAGALPAGAVRARAAPLAVPPQPHQRQQLGDAERPAGRPAASPPPLLHHGHVGLQPPGHPIQVAPAAAARRRRPAEEAAEAQGRVGSKFPFFLERIRHSKLKICHWYWPRVKLITKWHLPMLGDWYDAE